VIEGRCSKNDYEDITGRFIYREIVYKKDGDDPDE